MLIIISKDAFFIGIDFSVLIVPLNEMGCDATITGANKKRIKAKK